MTLKEKITEKSLIFPLCLEPSNQEIINYNLAIDKLEQVAEEFAIGFAEWYEEEILAKGDYNMIDKPKIELLEIYKETL